MKLDKNDPRLMDYVLNELTPDEHAQIEAALQHEDNAEARAEVAALRQVVGLSEAALAEEEGVAVTLETAQREDILEKAEVGERAPRKQFILFRPAFALAACAILGVGMLWIASNPTSFDKRAGYEMAKREMVKSQESLGYSAIKVDQQSGETQSQSLEELPAETIEQMKALGYIADEEVAAPEEWDDVEIGSISGVQAGVAIGEAEPEATAGAAPAPEPQPAAAAAPVPPAPMRAKRSVPVAPKPGSSLQNVQVGGEIRIRGNYYDAGQANRPQVAADGVEQLEALGYLEGGGGGGFGGGGGRVRSDWYYRQSANTETYLPIEEKDFVAVLQKPLSTFSIDVDTGAYSNVRRFIEQGQIPSPDAVRIEEMLNYFDYARTAHRDDAPFGVDVEVAPCPWTPEHWLSKVVVSGMEVEPEERGDANIVFLLDVSGSMSDANKLPLVKEAMEALVKELRPSDRVAIVTYASNSKVALRSTRVEEGYKIQRAIDALNAGGSTHGSAGIQDAYAIARHNFVKGGINRVILATDGDFNVGITNHNSLMELIAKEAKSNVFLTALGFGMGNYEDATLEQLADKGNGNYAYIDTFKEARKVLVNELSGTLITIAKDVKIQVEFNPAHVGHYRLIGYENRALADRDFNDDTKDAGEIGAGHQVVALYELVPAGQSPQPGVDALKYQEQAPKPEPATELSDEIMNVKLRYKAPEDDVSAKIEVPVKKDQITEQPSADFRFATAVAGYGLVMRNSEYKGSATLDDVVRWAESGKTFLRGFAGGASGMRKAERRWHDMEDARQEFIDLVVTTKTLLQR